MRISADNAATTKTSKKAITSYNNIFNTDTPWNLPLNVKNGKFLYINVAIGALNQKDITSTRISPTSNTTSLIKPLLIPAIIPTIKHIIITASNIFKKSHPIIH